MPICRSTICRTAGLFILRHGAEAPREAQRKYEELAAAGYPRSAETAKKVLSAIGEMREVIAGPRRSPSGGL
jgi:hypothetical protein